MKSRLELFCVLVLCFSLLLSQQSARAYTVEDVDRAREQKDYVLLKKITDDPASEKPVRLYALVGLESDVRITYLDSQLVKDEPAVKTYIYYTMAQHKKLELPQIPEAFAALVQAPPAEKRLVYFQFFQRYYVTQLAAAGRWEEALSESKRLIGLTRPAETYPASTLDTISFIIKGENFSRTQDVQQSLQAMEIFSKDVQEHTKKSTWFQLPYPGTSPIAVIIKPFEESENDKSRIWALLYAGKFDVARREADALFAQASTPQKIQEALLLIGQTMNGKEQRVDASNELLK